MRIEAIRAWPGRHESVQLDLREGATVAEAIRAVPFDLATCVGYAVHGQRAALDTVLHGGDRLELLRPLVIDPKAARRQRASRVAP